MKNAILLLALLSICSAACIENATTIVMQEQGFNILAVIGITIVIIALAYMLGSLLENPSYTVFAKDELYHLGFSLVILVGFSGILVFTCYLMDFFYVTTFQNLGTLTSGCYTEGAGLNDTSFCYVRLVKKDARLLTESYVSQHINLLMDSTFAWNIQWPFMSSFTVTGEAYKRIISNQYDMVANMFLIPALISVSMQDLALRFINDNAIRWILPIGFLLRIFIPTRQMGNMLLALAIGLYILVPFMYVFNFAMYDAILSDCDHYSGVVCDNTMDSYSCSSAPEVTCLNPNSFWNVAKLIPQAFFLPNLTIALVITFLSAVHRALKVVG